jgi:hypothetical protein
MNAGSVSQWAARAAARRQVDAMFARRSRTVEDAIAHGSPVGVGNDAMILHGTH